MQRVCRLKEEEVSVVNYKKMKLKTAAAGVHRVGRIQHLGSC
jgi:hypothetical protein